MKKLIKKFIIFLIILFVIFLLGIASLVLFYVKGLPKVVSSEKFISLVETKVPQYTGLDVSLKSPEIETNINGETKLKVDELKLFKGSVPIVFVKNAGVTLNLKDVFDKNISLTSFLADKIYLDVNKIIDAFPQSDKKQDFKFDVFNSVISIKDITIKYDITKDVRLDVDGKNLFANWLGNKKDVHFDMKAKISKKGKILNISANDENRVFTQKDKLIINNINLKINNSKMKLSLFLNSDFTYVAKVYANKFLVEDIVDVVNSKIVYEALSEPLSYLNDIKGLVDFNINIDNGALKGNVKLHKLLFKIKYVRNLPVYISGGQVDILPNTMTLKGFKGYYNNKTYNKLDFEGTIQDYNKTFNTNISGNALVTNNFATECLSKMIGYPMAIKGVANTRLVLTSVNGIMDFLWLYKFNKGTGFIINGDDFGSFEKERVLVSRMHLRGSILNIEKLDYFIGSPRDKDFNKIPILSFYGNVDLAKNCELKNFGFKIPEFLTSNFLNMLLKQNILRHGTIKGTFEYINSGINSKLRGKLTAEKIGVPSQRMFIRKAFIDAHDNIINITSNGKYKRSDYKIDADIDNKLTLPITVKNIDLTVDNIDVDKFLNSANSQKEIEKVDLAKDNSEELDTVATFDLSTIVVEKGRLKLLKGFYKELNFSNLIADLTFDKNQVLTISSNRFNFAQGISSAQIICDLKKQLYSIKLGVRDVDSNLITSVLFNIKKEISGKASGYIELNTDKTFKLNGRMGFGIDNGEITKIGLFEYILNCAYIFRNPLVAISPSTFFNLANVPDGKFDKIRGTLEIKDNVIHKISIYSSAPRISSYIAGKFDLNNRDAALRIYIKYSNRTKGFASFLRNISLNTIANSVPFGAKSSNNYYEREIEKIPPLSEGEEKDCQIFLTKVDGDIEHNNFISFLSKLK